ncbi:MAG: tetratricopeptide repeat protein [Chloracidobacterium sp.]|nr:tetratricopeptide repeat protein [Chloracidobacterium sp.]MCO5333411.1 tetratricopeptide repeat protein [Pyrinomonadaceae bacterium]
MIRTAALLLFIVSLCTGGACRKAVSNSASEANADAAAISPFADITDPNAALAEGDRLFDTNETEQAIEAYKRAVELNPDLADAYFKLGVAYGLLEKQALRSGTSEVVPGEMKGNKLVKTESDKMFEKAAAAYKKLVAASPDDAAAYFNLGRAYNKLNKDEEAEDALEKAVKLNPEDTEYQTELGAIRIKLAKYHQAIGPLKKALELDAENVEAEELLEDAEAGARRIDYSPPEANAAKKANANANVADADPESGPATATNTAPKPPANNKKPETRPETKPPTKPTPKPVSTRH